MQSGCWFLFTLYAEKATKGRKAILSTGCPFVTIIWYKMLGGVKTRMKSFLMILEAVVAIALIASVVLQSGKSAGMSGTIAGGAETLFGGKKRGLDDMLARITMVLGIVFAVLTLILGRVLSS